MKVLKEKRLASGLTVREITERVGVSRQVYWCYETGKKKPSVETLEKLAEVYHTSTDELLGRKSNDQ